MEYSVSIYIVLQAVLICKPAIPEFHQDHFYSGCNEIRYINKETHYQVEYHQTYVEDCVLKYHGYPKGRYKVCAKIVTFKLPCNTNRRISLFFTRDKVSNMTEFNCQSKTHLEDYCGEYVYMFLRAIPYSELPYRPGRSLLLINVTAVPKIKLDKTNNSKHDNMKGHSRKETEEFEEDIDTSTLIIACIMVSAFVVIMVSICLVIFFHKRRSRNSTFRSDQNGHPSRSVTSNTTRPNIAYRWLATPNEYIQLQSSSEVIPRSHVSNRDSSETVSLRSQDDSSSFRIDAVSNYQETPRVHSLQCNNLSSDDQNVETDSEHSPVINNLETEPVSDPGVSRRSFPVTNNSETEPVSDPGDSRRSLEYENTEESSSDRGVGTRSNEYYNTDQDDMKNLSGQSAAYQTLWD